MAEKGLRPLTPRELSQLLDSIEQDVVLVAGQALAFWASYFGLQPTGALAAGVTMDIDFLGSRESAQRHHEALQAHFKQKARIAVPQLGDVTPNSAIIIVEDLNGRKEPIIIDYLWALHGYKENDTTRLHAFAVEAEVHSRHVRVMHPYDCLKSRLHNVIGLPSKRNDLGFAQLRLAVQVVKARLDEICREGGQRESGFQLAERVISLAVSRDGLQVWKEHAIDLMEAVPADALAGKFRSERWPRACDWVTQKRRAYLRACGEVDEQAIGEEPRVA